MQNSICADRQKEKEERDESKKVSKIENALKLQWKKCLELNEEVATQKDGVEISERWALLEWKEVLDKKLDELEWNGHHQGKLSLLNWWWKWVGSYNQE